jgi:hypothetical protein
MPSAFIFRGGEAAEARGIVAAHEVRTKREARRYERSEPRIARRERDRREREAARPQKSISPFRKPLFPTTVDFCPQSH